MSVYPLMKNKNGGAMHPQSTSYSEKYAERMCDLYLTEEHSRDEQGHVHRQYRLHARHPHTIEMALDHTVQCPKCKVHNLKQIGRCLDSHTLGAYICPVCDKH